MTAENNGNLHQVPHLGHHSLADSMQQVLTAGEQIQLFLYTYNLNSSH